MEATNTSHVKLEPSIISNFSIKSLSDESHRKHLRELLGATQIVVIRGAVIETRELLTLAKAFGAIGPTLDIDVAHPNNSSVQIIERTEPVGRKGARIPSSSYWHADRSFLGDPPKATLLCARAVSDFGGATEFVSTRPTYGRLSIESLEFAHRIRARHSYSFYHQQLQRDYYSCRDKKEADTRFAASWHPLLKDDPFSGIPGLYLSQLCIDAASLDDEENESSEVLTYVNSLVQSAAGGHVYSHAWQAGDVVVWSNSALMHRATNSTGYRRLERVVVK